MIQVEPVCSGFLTGEDKVISLKVSPILPAKDFLRMLKLALLVAGIVCLA